MAFQQTGRDEPKPGLSVPTLNSLSALVPSGGFASTGLIGASAGVSYMRKLALVCGGVLALIGLEPAGSQIWIGQTVGNLMQPGRMPDSCYDGTAKINTKAIEKVAPWVVKAVQHYREVAIAQNGLAPVFAKKAQLSIDGAPVEIGTAKDPWITASTRLELDGFLRANAGTLVLARWRALSADGYVLGTYDAVLQPAYGGFRIADLKLSAPLPTTKLQSLKPFCVFPGDVEKWKEARARRDAEKAARRVSENRPDAALPRH